MLNASSRSPLRTRFLANYKSIVAPEEARSTEQPWRLRPLALAKRLRPEDDIQEPDHLRLIEEKIVAAVEGTGKRFIIVNMPPQNGKSQTISRDTPVWYLDRFPWKMVMVASYQAGYASNYSRMVRDAIRDSHGILNVYLKGDTRSRSEWYTTRDGGMVAQGIEGSFTGRRGDLVIVDDPIKNHREANSPTERQKIWDWYETTIESRLHPESIVIVVMTRWHEDDLVGRLLERDGEDVWEVLRFPAIAESNDVLGRQVGDPLWPERFPIEFLESVRDRRADYVWQGLYQQNPTQPSGSIVKRAWFAGGRNRFDWANRFSATAGRYISIDTAESEDPTSAFTVATVVEYTHARKLRTSHVERVRLEPADLEGWVKGLIDTFDFDGKLAGIVIEAKSTGVSLISTLRRVLPARYRRLIFVYRPRDSKDERLRRAAIWMRNDCVEFPVATPEAPWLDEFEREIFGAPLSRYRDQADSLAQIVIYLEAYLEQGYTERTARVGYSEAAGG